MKLKELKSVVEEREQLKSEIEEIAIDERSKLSERDKVLLDTVNSTITQGPEFAFKVGFPFFSKEAVILLKEKIARIQEIEKVIRDNLSTFDIQFTDLKKYVESYFDVKYGLDVNVQASNVHIEYDMYDTRATDFDLTIEIEGTNYRIANIDMERTNGEKIINLAKLIIPDIYWIIKDTGVEFIIRNNSQNDARAFYRQYNDFKNALWYAVSASKKRKLQEVITSSENSLKTNKKDLEELQSPECLLRLRKKMEQELRDEITKQEQSIKAEERALEELKANSDKYDL